MSVATTEWLDLAVPERIVFERTPLVLALCQVKFSPMLSVSNPSAVAPFQEAIIAEYPVAGQSQGQQVQVRVEGSPAGNQASVQSNLGEVSWRFSDVDDTWTAILAPDFLALETRAYRDFSEFEDRLGRLLGALDKTIHPTVGLRIGLRYVNEIRLTGDEWRAAIRPELLGALAAPPFGELVAQAFQQMQFREPDGMGVNLQHGLLPGGSVVDPRPGEAPPEGPFYVLDIDVFREFKPGELSMKPRVVGEYVQRFHDVMSHLFRWAVTEDYMATLGRA
jgi:uncharacterized protein (TIGR04255 family)